MIKSLQKHYILIFAFNILISGCYADTIDYLNYFKPYLKNFKLAVNKKNFNYIYEQSISKQEYVDIIKKVEISFPDCVGDAERNFDVLTFNAEFKALIANNLFIDHAEINSIEDAGNCEVAYKIVKCTLYLSNNKSIPASFVFMKNLNNKYKFIAQIINLKIISDEE